MTRPTSVHIDLKALRHNYRLARQQHGGRALAVLKANAYGHGALRCAQALQNLADGFAVAFLDEALSLREAGIQSPILVLEGAFDPAEVLLAATHRLWLVVHQESQVRMIETVALGDKTLQVWLKIDSGMHRVGFAPAQAAEVHARLRASHQVAGITLMTHFARADEMDAASTRTQIQAFEQATKRWPGPRSLCNSAGILGWPEAHSDWARPGIMLYGVDPLATSTASLQTVMHFHSEIFAERWLAPGDELGYGATFVAEQATRVGLVAAGYADGYPRCVPTGTPVAVDGHITRILGRVSMDMLTVDLTPLPMSHIGSRVELWGSQVTVSHVAQQVGTIAYELLCNVKRAPLQYHEDGYSGGGTKPPIS